MEKAEGSKQQRTAELEERNYTMTGSFKDLTVYQKAFDQAMRNFEVTKEFPKSEHFSLLHGEVLHRR